MIDFLRANPFVTKEDYMWKWSLGQIKLASCDFSHIEYLDTDDKGSDNNVKEIVINSAEDALKNDLNGIINP